MKNLRHILIVTALVIISTVGLRFLLRYVFALPFAASAEAQPIDTMFNVHFWMISFLFSLIMVIMLYSAFVFRQQPDDDTDGPHIHSNTALEIGWTIVPTFVVIGFGIYGAIVLNEITRPDPDEMVVNVTGKQWIWSFRVPGARERAVGRIGLTCQSAHSAEHECRGCFALLLGAGVSGQARPGARPRNTIAHHTHPNRRL